MNLANKYDHNFNTGDFILYDKFGNEIFREDKYGNWIKSIFKGKDKLVFREDKVGFIYNKEDEGILIQEDKEGIHIFKPYGNIKETIDCIKLFLEESDKKEDKNGRKNGN